MENSLNQEVLTKKWRLLPLAITHILALALLLSYLLPAGSVVWRSLDESIFYSLNGSLTGSGTWELIWAWANTRVGDLFAGILILVFLVYPISGFRGHQLQSALFFFSAMLLILLVLRTGFHYFCGWMELRVESPSLVLSPAIRLSEIFPSIPLKDASASSFPGDHATVLFAWSGFVIANRFCWQSCLAGCLPLLFVLPRLFSGAHWMSDQLVGGLVVAIPVLGWTYFTPVVGSFAKVLAKGGRPVIARLSSLPWFRNQHFFLDSHMSTSIAADK